MEQEKTKTISKENFTLNYGEFDKINCGIYKIEIENHLYIGSTSTKRGFGSRWSRHISDLIKNKHSNPKFQNIFNKYEYAIFTIIEVCEKEQCIIREQYYIDTLNPDINIRRIANSPLGIKQSNDVIANRVSKITGQKRTEEQKENMRQAHIKLMNSDNSPYNEDWKQKIKTVNIGRKASKETCEKIGVSSIGNNRAAKPILQYTKDGKFIKEWESAKVAKDTLNIKGNICQCLKGTRKSASGFVWYYKI